MLSLDFITFCHEEEIPIEGNASAIDPEEDSKTEEFIRSQLPNNPWAWCTIEVYTFVNGKRYSDLLGGCSYASAEDFEKSGYYRDMVETVLSDVLDDLIPRE